MPYNSHDALLNISKNAFANETELVERFLSELQLSEENIKHINENARDLCAIVRESKQELVDSFNSEFSLSTDEGAAIMCLAESLLRIPDRKTAIALIEDKLKDKNWSEHLGKSDSFMVNASSFGLFLAGKFMNKKSYFANLLGGISNPIILTSVKRAIQVISNKYILGENCIEALSNAKRFTDKGYNFSIDILGESARTKKQSDFYYEEYQKALVDIEKFTDKKADIYKNNNLSVKLTALHPRVMLKKHNQLEMELLPRLKELIRACKKINISLSFDAEEAFRQDVYLKILTELFTDKEFADYDGIGFVIQAYSRRASYIIDYLIELAKSTKKRLLIRLVKGAYWDSEIKFAQEYGLQSYPVFTRKEYTDVSYQACAKKLIDNIEHFYPQFATHNAQTIATIMELAGDRKDAFEFQRLQGMGESLHDEVLKRGYRSRIYAPVGVYEDLLAYLMRRLLENGANSSFVNQIYDASVPITKLAYSPIAKATDSMKSAEKFVEPSEIYGELRANSYGYDLGYRYILEEFEAKLNEYKNKTYDVGSLLAFKFKDDGKVKDLHRPADYKSKYGSVHELGRDNAIRALDEATKAQKSWDEIGVDARAKMLEKYGNLLHERRFELYSVLMKEGGKTIEDAISEVREAIDFAYYYASKAREFMASPYTLPSYTGEKNTLSHNPKGTFVCISPWNFPLAIFAGQVLASLVTGNTVLAKGASNTPVIAYLAVQLMHEAGIPKGAIQLLFVSGRDLSAHILSSKLVSGVCFTGSTEVANSINSILAARSGAIASFIAETGGQNAMIIDSSALLEQAADNVIISAFGSAGQRCSALRVAYVQEEIYDQFKALLADYINELKVADTLDLSTDIGPVIDQPSCDDLKGHINEMGVEVTQHQTQDGSFLMPHIIEINSITQLNKENFGPVLHLCKFKAKDLDKVIDEVNSVEYGLTFGLQTRIEDRIYQVAAKIKAGNFYANRSMIGAVVGTHPFGGENKSGTGFKAGGPHYLLKFMNERVLTINTTAIGGNLELLKSIKG